MLGVNWSTFSPAHYFPPSNIEWGGGGWRGLQKNTEYVIKSDLKDKTLYWPNEFAHDCRFAFQGATEPLSGSSIQNNRKKTPASLHGPSVQNGEQLN